MAGSSPGSSDTLGRSGAGSASLPRSGRAAAVAVKLMSMRSVVRIVRVYMWELRSTPSKRSRLYLASLVARGSSTPTRRRRDDN